MRTVIIIGAGPAGLMAAVAATEAGAAVVILEKMPSPGRKLLATGGGRCNFTVDGGIERFLDGFLPAQAKFLRSAAHRFPPEEMIAWLEARGVAVKRERGNRVFPQSDRAKDVLDALLKEAHSFGARIISDAAVTSIAPADGALLVKHRRGDERADAVIIATGGLSMERTGSSGDGYRLAASLGHAIAPPRPSLIPLLTGETWPGSLAGLSLRNVEISVSSGGKRITRFGEMIFTQRGIGGPIVIELSRFLLDDLSGGPVACRLDLKPALDDAQLDRRLIREIESSPRRLLRNIMKELMPVALGEAIGRAFNFDLDQPASSFGRDERRRLAALLKAIPLTIIGTAPIEDAIVTCGGVSLKEIDPRTMESRLVPGLFFAGEVIDIDGDCGGYNLQAAWSTGRLAGRSAANP
jgi:hypothetical protein